jgi:hypothetical protein
VTGCTTYSTAPGSTNQPVTTVTAGCGYQPTVAVAGNDVVTLATATPTTVNYIVNGEYRGTSAPAVKEGNNWRIVADLTGYLAVEDSKDIPCGATTFAEKLYAYANATVTIKDDPVSSSNTLTNGGGANNATKASAGGYRQFPIIFQGTAQKSTGNIFWVI